MVAGSVRDDVSCVGMRRRTRRMRRRNQVRNIAESGNEPAGDDVIVERCRIHLSSGTGPAASASVLPAALVGATTIDGQPFDATALAGRPTVVWFWAPWCVICRGEAPNVASIASRYAGKVNFVGVAGRGTAPEMRDFVKKTHTEAITHLDDGSGEIWLAYKIYAQPAYAFITDDGRLKTFTGALGEDKLGSIVDQLLVA